MSARLAPVSVPLFFVAACLLLACAPTRPSAPAIPSPSAWVPLNAGLPSHVPVLALARPDEATLFAATYDTVGLYASLDGGKTWQADNRGLEPGPVLTLLSTPHALWAGTVAGLYMRQPTQEGWQRIIALPDVATYALWQSAEGKLYAGTDGRGVYVSADAGQTWTHLAGLDGEIVASLATPDENSLLVGTSGHGVFRMVKGSSAWEPAADLANGYVSLLMLDPTNAHTVYARTRTGLYRSGDGGTTWNKLGGGIDKEVVDSLLMEPVRHRLWAGTGAHGVWYSDDDGASWTGPRDNKLQGQAVLSLAFRGDTLLAGTAEGVFASQDGGETWRPGGEGLGTPQAQAVALTPDGARLYLINDAGLFSARTQDYQWERVAEGGLGPAVLSLAMAPNNPHKLLVGTSHQGVFYSEDGGATWQGAHGDLGGRTSVVDLQFAPHDSQNVYARVLYERIYHSTDGGVNWHAVWSGMPPTTEVESIAIDEQHSSVVYAGTNDGLYYSTDGGETWAPRGLAGLSVLALWTDPTRPGRVLAGTTDGLYESLDAGEQWRAFALVQMTVTVIAQDARGRLIAGTKYNGVYIDQAANSAAGWQPLGRGLEDASINSLQVDTAHGLVYAATTRGIFQYRLPP